MSGPAYRIETARLCIRCYDPADARLLDSAISESLDHLRATMNWARQEPMGLEKRVELLRRFRAAFDRGEEFNYGAFSPDESSVLGGGGLHPRVGPDAREIGYWIHADATRRGLATELAAALTRAAIEVDGAKRVEIHCDPDNQPSARVAEKLGFHHEATLKKRLPALDGGLRDRMIWTLFAEDYPRSAAAKVAVTAYDAAGNRVL